MKLPINLKGKDINNEEITIEITNNKNLRLERQNLSSIEKIETHSFLSITIFVFIMSINVSYCSLSQNIGEVR